MTSKRAWKKYVIVAGIVCLPLQATDYLGSYVPDHDADGTAGGLKANEQLTVLGHAPKSVNEGRPTFGVRVPASGPLTLGAGTSQGVVAGPSATYVAGSTVTDSTVTLKGLAFSTTYATNASDCSNFTITPTVTVTGGSWTFVSGWNWGNDLEYVSSSSCPSSFNSDPSLNSANNDSVNDSIFSPGTQCYLMRPRGWRNPDGTEFYTFKGDSHCVCVTLDNSNNCSASQIF